MGIGEAPTPGPKRRCLRGAQKALYAVGAAGLYGRLRDPGRFLVLMYHSICPREHEPFIAPRNRMSPERFEGQMKSLARSRRVVSLDRVLDAASGGEPLPDRAVVLTFDDGYRDNLTVAADILDRYELPAVLYLATGYVTAVENQWADLLYSHFSARTRPQLEVGETSFDLEDPEQLAAAHAACTEKLLPASLKQRVSVLADLEDRLRPETEPPQLTLDWDEARSLREQHPGFVLGVHTSGHVDLRALPREAAVAEVELSVREFESALDYAPLHFSYPYSRVAEGLSGEFPGLGLRSAMGGEGTAGIAGLDPFDIPRLPAPESRLLLGYYASGAHPGLSKAMFGRA